MTEVLILLNDPPYGTERSYNGLRMALALGKAEPEVRVHVFLMADAVLCAKAGQTTPEGYYNTERQLRALAAKGCSIGACATCMNARGLTDAELTTGAHRSSMAELATWTVWADKIITW
jgi:uncharacterized protein involved in oxidation of intracellular sulfur